MHVLYRNFFELDGLGIFNMTDKSELLFRGGGLKIKYPQKDDKFGLDATFFNQLIEEEPKYTIFSKFFLFFVY
jgi:hypothetical protein